MNGILEYNDKGEILKRISKRAPVDLPKLVGKALIAQFWRKFRNSPDAPPAGKSYNLRFGDGPKLEIDGPSFLPGPKLAIKYPSVPAFMPGEKELCVMKASDLTTEQRSMGQGGSFSFFSPSRFLSNSEQEHIFGVFVLRACCVAEHIIEIAWIRDWLNELYKKYPKIALEIVQGPLKMWTGYEKHGGEWAGQVTVIEALMYNIGSTTDGAALMSILERDINIAKACVCHLSHSSHFSGLLTSHER